MLAFSWSDDIAADDGATPMESACGNVVWRKGAPGALSCCDDKEEDEHTMGDDDDDKTDIDDDDDDNNDDDGNSNEVADSRQGDCPSEIRLSKSPPDWFWVATRINLEGSEIFTDGVYGTVLLSFTGCWFVEIMGYNDGTKKEKFIYIFFNIKKFVAMHETLP